MLEKEVCVLYMKKVCKVRFLTYDNVKKIVVVIVACFYMYPFKLNVSYWWLVDTLYYCMPVFFCIRNINFLKRRFGVFFRQKYVLCSLIFLSLSLLWSFLVFASVGDFSFITECYFKPVWLLIRFIFIYLIALKTYDDSFVSFIRVMMYATVLYVFFSIIMIINMDFALYWMSILELNKEIVSIERDFTRIGLMGRTFADTSMAISLLLLGIYCYNGRFNLEISDKIGVIFLLLGNFLYGRLGLVMSLMIICCMFKRTTVIKARTLLKYFILFAVFFVILEVIFLNVDPMILDYTISWVFEPVEALLFSSSSNFSLGDSGDTLLNEMYFSIDNSTFLLGDGFYESNGQRYMGTDAAFMRKVLYGGIIQILLLYLSAAFLLGGYYRRYRYYHSANINKIIFLSGVLLLLGEFKDTLYPRWYVMMVMFYIAQLNIVDNDKMR